MSLSPTLSGLVTDMLKRSQVREEEKIALVTTTAYRPEILDAYLAGIENLGAEALRVIGASVHDPLVGRRMQQGLAVDGLSTRRQRSRYRDGSQPDSHRTCHGPSARLEQRYFLTGYSPVTGLL